MSFRVLGRSQRFCNPEKRLSKLETKQFNKKYDDRLLIKPSSNKLSTTGQRARKERAQKASDSNREQTQLPHLLAQP